MAVTTAVLSGNITDLVGDFDLARAGSFVLAIETNTDGSLLLDTTGKRLMAGAKRVTVDKQTGAYSVTLVRTDSADVSPTTGRLYRAFLQYPSGIPGAGAVKRHSGWFALTGNASLSDANKWDGLATTTVPQTVYENMTDSLMTGIDSNSASGFRVQQDARLSATYVRAGIVAPGVNGIVGNGTTDDRAAIQAVLNAYSYVYVAPGTYLVSDALTVPSNCAIVGAGVTSILKSSATLATGGAGIGHRILDATAKTGFRVANLMLDASPMTTFASGVRNIWLDGSSDFALDDLHFKTPGAAYGAIGCSKYRVTNPVATIISTDAVAHHDGIFDQWAGCHDFQITNPIVHGGGIGKYGILVTGETTAGVASACYNFTITAPQVYNTIQVGILVNGRGGINHTFTITSPVVDTVTTFHGIGIADSDNWTLSSPVVKNTGANGIRVYSETATRGLTGGRQGAITSPVVINANIAASGSSVDGAGIAVTDNSTGITLTNPRVKGATHTYGTAFGTSTTACNHVPGQVDAGTLGKIYNGPNGGTYTPTFTAVANVTTVTGGAAVWTRDADLVTVSGRCTVTPTAAASTATQAGISLPIASNLASATTDLFGVGATQFGTVAAISADITNDRAQMQFPATSTAGNIFYYSFTYKVL